MTHPTSPPSEAFFSRVFGEWRAEFRAILEGHKQDIQARLEKIELSLEKKSDKEHVTLLVTGLQEDLRRHAQDINHIQNELTQKLNTEALWKLIGLVLTVGSAFGGLIGFVVSMLLRSRGHG
ncbi:hypothetical protein SCOR_15090 [Sulfidibacter corallicola]|uniref:hypothetical protein n=1 Tax=Sulfidibacter corallicola TaxID=2818388 RepID=UPI001F460851|nr:hypothetical protein [Sulfidibacter corallicola]